MSKLLKMSNMLALSMALVEAGGPVVRKKTLEDYEREDAERAERNARQYERLQALQAQEDARRAAQLALTSNAEWSRIERDEKRRADKKAAKKLARHLVAPKP